MIKIYNQNDFNKMSQAGKLAAQTLNYIAEFVKPSISTDELNDLCHNFIISHGAIPAPLNYKGFPKSICTSINNVVCHGIPNSTKLMNGDIINIDVTVILDGWYGDTSRTYFVGTNINPKVQKLVKVTYDAMMLGIEVVKPGNTFGDIGYAIQNYVEKHKFSVVRDYCGHGIGQVFHDEPNVLHYGIPGTGAVIKEGMCFTIEPMVNIGSHETRLSNDGWTVTTKDRSLSAQFEHTIGVTQDGYCIFTL